MRRVRPCRRVGDSPYRTVNAPYRLTDGGEQRTVVKRMRTGENIRRLVGDGLRAKRMTLGMLGLAFAGSILLYPFQTTANECRAASHDRTSEAEISIEVRKLMTDLMVAALRCGARSDYNAFVLNYQPTIKKYGRVIRGEFKRRYGSSGRRQLNKYVTKLANEASARSSTDRDAFCAAADSMFRESASRKTDLARLALTYAGVSEPGGNTQIASASCPPLQTTVMQPVDEANRAQR